LWENKSFTVEVQREGLTISFAHVSFDGDEVAVKEES
jgi:hypothetical protein